MNSFRRYKFLLPLMAVVMILISPIFAEAHVKWFTQQEAEKVAIEEILSPLFMVLSLLVAVILSVLTLILQPVIERIPLVKKINGFLDQYRISSRYILKYGTALALAVQVLTGSLFAPEFEIHSRVVLIVAWSAIVLLCIPVHYATKVGAVLLLGLFFFQLNEAGLFHMLDYGFYLAIIAVLLIGKTKLEDWGFPFLYLGTGLSLCWVAVEKWVYPAMSVDIIQNHGVPTFGFDPEVFVVLAAYIEFIVGYLLIVGILNRVLALVLTLIFISTTMLFGVTEIIGHLMIHIVLIIFVIEGVSFYDPPIKIHKTKLNQIVFIFLNFLFTLSAFLLIYYRFA